MLSPLRSWKSALQKSFIPLLALLPTPWSCPDGKQPQGTVPGEPYLLHTEPHPFINRMPNNLLATVNDNTRSQVEVSTPTSDFLPLQVSCPNS